MDRRAGRVDRADGVLEGLVGLVAVVFAAAAPQHDRRHQQYSPGTAREQTRPARRAVVRLRLVRAGAEVPLAVGRGLEALRLEAGGGLDRGGRVDEAEPRESSRPPVGELRAVSSRSFLIWAGVRPGRAPLTSATAPETKAEAALVPHPS